VSGTPAARRGRSAAQASGPAAAPARVRAPAADVRMVEEVAAAVSAARTVEELARPLLALLRMVTGLDSTYLTRADVPAGVQRVLFSLNAGRMEIPEGTVVPWGETLCRRAIEEERLHCDDVPGTWGDCAAAAALGIRTYVTAPVRLEDGALFGTLCGVSADRRPVDDLGRTLLSLFGVLIEQHVRREHLLERLRAANETLERSALTDPLTGLPNRRAVLRELDRLFARTRRSGDTAMVAFIDLDGFKAINDAHGHDAGDAFLVEVGRRLAAGARAGDVAGRIGGDEFVVVGAGPPAGGDGAAAGAAARARLADVVRGRYDLGVVVLDYPGASIGVVCVDPGEVSAEEALRRADEAMYADKAARRAGAAARPR